VKRGHVSCGLGLLEEGMIDVSCIFGFNGSNEVYLQLKLELIFMVVTKAYR